MKTENYTLTMNRQEMLRLSPRRGSAQFNKNVGADQETS